MPQQLNDAPELSDELMYLWYWFIDMNNTERGSGMVGIERITSSSMIAWQCITGNYLQLWERRALRIMDFTWVAEMKAVDD